MSLSVSVKPKYRHLFVLCKSKIDTPIYYVFNLLIIVVFNLYVALSNEKFKVSNFMHVICMDGIMVWGPPNNLQLWKKLMSNSLLVTGLTCTW